MQIAQQPIELHIMPIQSSRQQLDAQRFMARMLVRLHLPIAAEAALSAPIPKDAHGNIIDGPPQARTSCTARYGAHGADVLQACASATGSNDADTFLARVADVVERRNRTVHPSGNDWLQLQEELEGLERTIPGKCWQRHRSPHVLGSRFTGSSASFDRLLEPTVTGCCGFANGYPSRQRGPTVGAPDSFLWPDT